MKTICKLFLVVTLISSTTIGSAQVVISGLDFRIEFPGEPSFFNSGGVDETGQFINLDVYHYTDYENLTTYFFTIADLESENFDVLSPEDKSLETLEFIRSFVDELEVALDVVEVVVTEGVFGLEFVAHDQESYTYCVGRSFLLENRAYTLALVSYNGFPEVDEREPFFESLGFGDNK